MHLSETTTRSRKKVQSPRVAQRTDFFSTDIGYVLQFLGIFTTLGSRKPRLTTLMKHYKTEGIEPRIHKRKKVLPHNVHSKDDYDRVRNFIRNHAECHARPLPGRIPQSWKSDVLLLPTDCAKISVYIA